MTPETEAFLARVRDAEAPSPAAEQRVLEAVRAAVSVPPAAAAGASAAAGVKTALKLAVWIAGLAATSAAVKYAVDLPSARAPIERPAATSTPASSLAEPLAQPTPAIASSQTAPPEPAASRPRLDDAAAERARRTSAQAAASASPSHDRPRPPRAPDSLRRELALLTEVHAAIRRGDGAAALRRLDDHRTADRQLLPERRAARVFALCAAGRIAEAQLAAADFARRYPNAPQRAAVARACESAPLE